MVNQAVLALMRILATGKNKPITLHGEHGFTLIEILLVIVIVTVLSAMVIPSFFSATGASVEGEARSMQKILRIASDEAQLGGKLMRCSVYNNHLSFEQASADGHWHNLADPLFQAYAIHAPVFIEKAYLNGDVSLKLSSSNQEKPPLARFYLWPDGRVSTGRIRLASHASSAMLMIQLASGAGGIHILTREEI